MNGEVRQLASRYPALDGLRGLAIAIVLAHHGLLDTPGTSPIATVVRNVAGAGWIGVDLFFVLSGFLITGVLLDAVGNPHYARTFYVRRALRILPLYYAVVVTTAVLSPGLGAQFATAYRHVAWHTPWLWVHAFNVYLAAHGSWRPLGPVAHLWSLGVEEQFYLVWPLVVWAVRGPRLRRWCVALAAAGVILRTALSLLGVSGSALYVLPATRLDGFAVGGWLALAARDPVAWPRVVARVRWITAAAAPRLATLALAVLAATLAAPRFVMQTAGFAALAVGFGALLAAALAAPATAPLGRLLRARALRTLGAYSYCLYIVHPLVLARLGAAGVSGARLTRAFGIGDVAAQGLVLMAMVALSFVLAWTSWRVLEGPCLRLKERLAPLTPLGESGYRPAVLPSPSGANAIVPDAPYAPLVSG